MSENAFLGYFCYVALCHVVFLSLESLKCDILTNLTQVCNCACYCGPLTGSANRTLLDNPDLYISRDGGITWEETLAGSWGVNVADHGGLLVAARDYHQEQSRELMYSCNEGYSWLSFEFSTVRSYTV